ncbi:hypothetical protein BDQ94DRAFT_76215 [Aspergillus welwitschiae]|uniref:Uncharacterized protein n=1 Tax=Aspergillus welwitschiae TaxID=1341132 RepID=A0A3F3PU01_9EURO|nr:hypothetical protein BDQ94DRAFT_76215 [Aspergillus welwitschiae]RDH30417.1 hypothetical protein BDQ94DRAFT_76215 [Aspergillus welwitschiae]
MEISVRYHGGNRIELWAGPTLPSGLHLRQQPIFLFGVEPPRLRPGFTCHNDPMPHKRLIVAARSRCCWLAVAVAAGCLLLLLENLISCGSSLLPTSFHGCPVLSVQFWVLPPSLLCFPYTAPSLLLLPVDPVCSGPSVGETRCLRYPSLLPTWLVPSRYLSVTQLCNPGPAWLRSPV